MNKAVGVILRAGVLARRTFIFLRCVAGPSGRIYATPVNLFEIRGKPYLVGGRGHTAWSKNAGAVGVVTLRRGQTVHEFRVIPLSDDRKPAILTGLP